MKINLSRISIVIFIIITNGCKKDKVTEPFHKDIYKYSYEPILKVLNKQLLVFLDSVILDKQKCSTYREKIVFNLQSVNNYEVDINTKTDTIINYFRISQAGYFTNELPDNSKNDKLIIGCFWYKNHLFNVFVSFKNSQWFSKTGKCLQYLKIKQKEDHLLPPSFGEPSMWIYNFRNGKIHLNEKYVHCNDH